MASEKSASPVSGAYHLISSAFPRSSRTTLRQMLIYAGVKMEADIWLGQIVLASIAVGALFAVVTWGLLFQEPSLVAAAFALGVTTVAVSSYVQLTTQIDERRTRIERVLPDALHIMAANVRTGMPPMIALRMSARPEFGPLEEEIKYVTTKSLGTESFTDAMNEMSKRIPSDIFARTISLVAASLKAGGRLAQLLESVAEDIRETQDLKSELVTNSNLYLLFIAFTVALGTPLLLAVSAHFVVMVADLQKTPIGASLGDEAGVSGIGMVINTPFSVDFVQTAGYVVLIVGNIMAAALIGAIREGREASGLKYAPILIVISFAAYFIVKNLVLQFLQSA